MNVSAPPALDLHANLNNEDDEGFNWALVSDPDARARLTPGMVLTAGTKRFWSWVRIIRVDDDGQVHFEQLSAADAEAAGVAHGAPAGRRR